MTVVTNPRRFPPRKIERYSKPSSSPFHNSSLGRLVQGLSSNGLANHFVHHQRSTDVFLLEWDNISSRGSSESVWSCPANRFERIRGSIYSPETILFVSETCSIVPCGQWILDDLIKLPGAIYHPEEEWVRVNQYYSWTDDRQHWFHSSTLRYH